MKIYRATNLPGSVQLTYRNPCSKPTVSSKLVTGFAQQVVDLSTFFHHDPLYRATNLPCRRLSCGEPTASVQQTYRAFRPKNEPCNEPTAYRALNLPSWHMVIHSLLHSWTSFFVRFCIVLMSQPLTGFVNWMFSCNKPTVGLQSCSKPTVLRLHSLSPIVQQTYRL